MLEDDYPYAEKEWGTCKLDRSKAPGKISSFTTVPHDPSGAQLKAALNRGPVSIAIEAGQPSFLFYKSGVITQGCDSKLDHGLLAVGYGTENGQDYFLVKNDWTDAWGDKGYAKIAPSQCGITQDPSYPIV